MILLALLNFKFKINQALSLVSSEEQVTLKFNLNVALTLVQKFLDLAFQVLVLWFSGSNLGFFPTQVYISHTLFNHVRAFLLEVDKYRKFRAFLRNLNNDYPQVTFDNADEQEECAICKDNMVQARRLPCNHCFH